MVFEMSKNDLREKILEIVENEWPIHASGIARRLGLPVDAEPKKVTARIKYYLNELENQEKILTKRIDRALVVWPTDIERIRFVNEMMR